MSEIAEGTFSKLDFKAELARKGYTKKAFATLIGISESALYRKINHGGSFTSAEIKVMIETFGTEKTIHFLFGI